MGSLASPALVPGSQQQRPVWAPGFPQMFESQAKGCPGQAQALPPGSCVTLGKSLCLGIPVSSRVARADLSLPCLARSCPGPWTAVEGCARAVPGVRAGSRGHRAPCQGQERRPGWEPEDSPVAAGLWVPQYIRRSWGLPLHWSPRVFVSTALSPQGEPRGVKMSFWSSQSLGAGGACHKAAP